MCFAAACVCFTIKILFNITEAARLWAVDERVHMLHPILGNKHQKIPRLWRVVFFFCPPAFISSFSCAAAGEQPDVALPCHVSEVLAHLLQSSPRGLLHVDSGPQHVVERGQEVMTDVQGKLLNGLHLSDREWAGLLLMIC